MKNNKSSKANKTRNTGNGKKVLFVIIFIISCLVIGGVIGFLSDKYLNGFMDTYIKNDNIFVELINIYGLILIFVVGYFIHIIIHEAGHLIAGFMTGYSFVSFRIGSFTLIKEDGKLRQKKFNIPGTAGQCLMMPPTMIDGKYPFVIYNFGGVIINLITSIIGILIVIFVEGVPFPINAILVLFGAAGIFAAVTNGIPLKVSGVANDGYNVISMAKDEEAKNAFYVQLRVNGLQSFGERIKDMPLEMFKLSAGANLTNPLNTSIRLMEYNWYLDNMDFEGARKSLGSFEHNLEKLVPLYRLEVNCERMFLELIGNCDKDVIDKLYDKTLKKYMKAAKFMIGKKRVIMAYEAFYTKDMTKALKCYKEGEELAKKYPVKGEADMELMIMNWIKEK
ncbi:MAG: hypothetical protein RR891_05650 [Clostridium sp.]|uniref:hypothetical protein n=1 Tax=Clostridium sp. TaxID=1506 RepID=UPI0030534B0E